MQIEVLNCDNESCRIFVNVDKVTIKDGFLNVITENRGHIGCFNLAEFSFEVEDDD